jgi:4-amino-4-deoxy-L-arabinose transferase-like glycosyltransferase
MACVRMAAANMASRSLAAWAVLAAIILAINLGAYPLLDPDEGRNGEVGREMAVTNDYVMPRIDGLPYLDKPIVYFAAEAAVMEVAGPTEFAARFPAWLFTIATALMIAWFAIRAGINAPAAAIMFLSMPLTIAFARTVIFDSGLVFFITAALIAFYLEKPTAAWAAMAFGVITKGPIALIALAVAIPYAIWRKRARTLISVAGVILFVVIIAPWVWAVSQVVPDFLKYVLVTETAQRLTTAALKRTGPPWYFIPYLLGGALPWVFSVRRAASGDQDRWLERYLLLWIAVPFVFFSLSQSKRPQYILPLMPAIALLAARRWDRQRAAAIALAVIGALMLAAIPFVNIPFGGGTAIIIGAAALICGAIAIFSRGALALIALSIPMLLIPIVTGGVMRSIAGRRSEKAFVSDLRPFVGSGDIVGIQAFTGTMAFYLQRPIILVSRTGEELTSNYIIRHYSDFASRLKPPEWLQDELKKRGTLFIVRNNDAVNRAQVEAHGGRLVAESPHFVAYTMPP